MSYSKYYNPTNWENYPSEDTAINAMHLNNLEDGVDTLDDRIVALSTDKSEVSWNQTLISGEKIAEITVNGITKDVYAPEISDSVVEQAAEQALKSEGYAVGTQGDVPVTSGLYYHNNSKYYSEQASDSASDASASAVEAGQSADGAEEEALVSEGWAVGEQNGVPVPSTSPYYHNNSKYWSEQSNPTKFSSLSDVNFGTLEDGDIPVYDATSQKWKNEVGVSADLKSNTTGQFNTRTGGILQSCVVNLEPIQNGSGNPSPSNVRPITGHSSVEVDVCGINIFSPLSYETVDLTGSGAYRYGHIYSTGTYTIINKSAQQISYRLPKADLSDRGTTVNINANSSATVTVDSTHVLWVFMFTWSSSVAEKICVRKDNDTTFVEFNGTDYTIPLGQTVYGGTLDVVSGVLTVDKGFITLNGNAIEVWTLLTGTNYHQFIYYIADSKNSVNAITNRFSKISLNERGSKTGLVSYETDSNFRFALKDDELLISDVTAWKTWLASNNVQVCYELATPRTIQLTPQQIETLIGQNDISVPLEGQTLDSLSYREMMAWDDVEKAVAVKLDLSSVAPIEYTDKASQSYNQKQLFIKDNKLCQALASISSGASFTENTNFKYTTLAEIIEPLIP